MEDAPAEERKTQQRVACNLRGGLILQLTEEFRDEFGLPSRRRNGPQVFVAGPTVAGAEPAITDVDPDFFAEWVKQNERSLLVTGRSIYPVDAEGKPVDKSREAEQEK